MEQYFHLLSTFNPGVLQTEESKIMFASSFLSDSAAIWWYTIVQSGSSPTTWSSFCEALKSEFVPADYVRRARDRLRRLKQTGSVTKYLSEFRKVILTLPDVTEGEKLDKFVQGLKHNVRIEVLKSTASTFDEVTHIALRVDSVIRSFKDTSRNLSVPGSSGVIPMEVKNWSGNKSVNGSQRQKDINSNACFVCHKQGCRSWKHKNEVNTVAEEEEVVDITLENSDSKKLIRPPKNMSNISQE